MLKLRSTTTVDAVDTDLLLAALPELLRRWRALEFIRGTVIDRNGRRREGLQVEQGTHPRAGTRYRIATYEPEPEASATTAPAPGSPPSAADGPRKLVVRQVDVTADDLDHLGLRFTDPEGPVTDVELRRPQRPDRLTTVTVVDVPGRWPFRGALTVDARLDLAALPRRIPGGDEPQLVVDVRHRLLRASVRVLIVAAGGRWDIAVDASIAGRGIARPLFHPAVPFVRRALKQEMADAVDHLPEDVASFNREVARLTAMATTPSDLAGIILDIALADVVETIPAG